MRLVYLAIPILSIFVSGLGFTQTVKITGLGASNCKKYIDDTSVNETNAKTYFAWAQGFMNGALVRAPVGVDNNLDLIPVSFPIAAQMSFLQDWCKINTNSDFSDASFALFKELRSHAPK